MQSLFLTVTLLVLVAVLQAQDDLPFLSEEKKISGVWFVKATVSDRNLTKLRPEVSFPNRVSFPEQGTLEIRTTILYEGQCIKVGLHMQRTEEPGKYSSFSNHVLFHIYELPVKDHYIIYTEILLSEKKSEVVDLLGKHPKENTEALEEFKKFIQRKGLLQENIIVPEQRVRPFSDLGAAEGNLVLQPSHLLLFDFSPLLLQSIVFPNITVSQPTRSTTAEPSLPLVQGSDLTGQLFLLDRIPLSCISPTGGPLLP
ncbi:vomeronasal secretory protein 2-like [Peromyscus leucopus]|uniref:vomeronasal secretory protein 2-like n=1 Tax=Peromyscus leucopus TaxID=10041 RepID=UPI0010A12B15|nr:vomeronasal secretory protein 2-like [Peromyscus leucopus]